MQYTVQVLITEHANVTSPSFRTINPFEMSCKAMVTFKREHTEISQTYSESSQPFLKMQNEKKKK